MSMDQMLIDSGLFGRGLVPIATPKGVAMFNEALGTLGIGPTKLTRFDIDGIGWSPQIGQFIGIEQGSLKYKFRLIFEFVGGKKK